MYSLFLFSSFIGNNIDHWTLFAMESGGYCAAADCFVCCGSISDLETYQVFKKNIYLEGNVRLFAPSLKSEKWCF